jgi:hypothetical protein
MAATGHISVGHMTGGANSPYYSWRVDVDGIAVGSIHRAPGTSQYACLVYEDDTYLKVRPVGKIRESREEIALKKASKLIAENARKRVERNGLLMTIGANPKKSLRLRKVADNPCACDNPSLAVAVCEVCGKPIGGDEKRVSLADTSGMYIFMHAGCARRRRANKNPKRGGRAVKNDGGSGLRKTYTTSDLGVMKGVPGADKAFEAYKKFHGAAPNRVKVFEYDDGVPGVRTRALFAIGPTDVKIDTVEDTKGKEVRIKPLEISQVYRVDSKTRSTKAGKQFIHSNREGGGTPQLNTYDPLEKTIRPLGGQTYVSDWIRK